MRVCVVGAGFAGLAAAAALADGGVEPLVLEARERVGGRVHSRRLPNGAVAELGAEFVERDQQAVVATAGRLGLELVPTGMAYGDREPRGGVGVTGPPSTRSSAGCSGCSPSATARPARA
jgi:monoamine oxidase